MVARDEGFIDVEGGRVWWYSVGEGRVPTLIVSGEDDEARPAHMQDMHRRIPGSEIQIFPDASHLCFWEQRGDFMATVNRFLDRVEKAA